MKLNCGYLFIKDVTLFFIIHSKVLNKSKIKRKNAYIRYLKIRRYLYEMCSPIYPTARKFFL